MAEGESRRTAWMMVALLFCFMLINFADSLPGSAIPYGTAATTCGQLDCICWPPRSRRRSSTELRCGTT